MTITMMVLLMITNDDRYDKNDDEEDNDNDHDDDDDDDDDDGRTVHVCVSFSRVPPKTFCLSQLPCASDTPLIICQYLSDNI